MRVGSLRRRIVAVTAVAVTAVGMSSASAGEEPESEGTYTNAVTEGTVDTFPDPVTIKGKDGAWYAYGTTNPIFQSRGEDGERYLPILRSENLVDWKHVGDVFTQETFPDWFGNRARLWAPDVRYVNGRYYLYYSVAESSPGGIGVVTAPTPVGPWTDSGGSVVPTGQEDCPTGDIDPAQFTDVDGTHYFYWGSYDVVCVARMNADATRIVGEAEEVLLARRGEGPFVVRHDDWYYLFYSEAGCCQGTHSGYAVKVGRAKTPLGPFLDPQGTPLTAPKPKDGFVIAANGNRWVGPGHHGWATDLSGQDWLVYHAIPKDNPDMKPVGTTNRLLSRRPMLVDRVDWVDGWPTVRAGRWASEGTQAAPVTTPTVGSDFNTQKPLDGWRTEGAAQDGWAAASEGDSGGYVRQQAPAPKPSYLVSDSTVGEQVRVQADVRLGGGLPRRFQGSAGLVLAYRSPDDHIAVWLDASRRALVSDVYVDGVGASRRSTPLPANFDFSTWHGVAAELRGTALEIEVSGSGQGDPLAVQTRTVPASAVSSGAVGVLSTGRRGEADNVSAAQLHQPVTDIAPAPAVGALDPALSDEFDDGAAPGVGAGDGWRWVRDAEGVEADGQFRWATNGEELFEGRNDASVLLRGAPQGEWTAETKLTFAPDSAGQQAGLIAYANDDTYAKLVHVPLQLNPRFGGQLGDYTEFAMEGPRPTINDPVFYGPMYVGPPAEMMWLRLHHRFDSVNNEHELRAATSTDGQRWVWGGVWALDGDLDLDIGLVTLNRPGATAGYDYFRMHRP